MDITTADLVQRFDSGEIRLPLMQRDYVWKGRKVLLLLDSLYRGWPIGSFYVWHTRESHSSRERAGRSAQARALDGLYGFLLDGQQRLTSLSLSLQGEAEGDLATRAFFDVSTEAFVLGCSNRSTTKRIEKGDPRLVPLSDLVILSPEASEGSRQVIERVLGALRELGEFEQRRSLELEYRRRLDVTAAMLRRRATCEEFRDEDEEHAFELFSRLNRGGTTLQAGDVAAARLASTGTRRVVPPMRALVAEPVMRALGINFLMVLRALITVHRGSCSFSKLPKNWADDSEQVEDAWLRTERALRLVVSFVREEMGWRHRRWLPSTMALLPLVQVLATTTTEPLDDREAVLARRYLLLTGLRSLFRGASETTVNSHVNSARAIGGSRLRRLRALLERIPKNRRYKIRRDDLLLPAATQTPVMQVYLAFLHAANVPSWPSGESLFAKRTEGAESIPVVRHLFPRALAHSLNMPPDRVSVPANYVILRHEDDLALSAEMPLESWQRMRPSQREVASRQLCFSASDHLLRPQNVNEFLEFRAGKLAEQINEFAGLG